MSSRGARAAIYVSVLLYTAAASALHLLVPAYLSRGLHLGPAAIGAVVGVFGLASLAARLPVGAIYTDRRSGLLIVVGGGISAGAFVLVPLVHGVVPFGALLALDGLGWSLATTAQLALLVASTEGRSTAAAMGWYSGFTGLGNMVAGVMAGVSADMLGFRASFFALAGLLAVGTLLLVLAARVVTAQRGAVLAAVERRPRISRRVLSMPAAVWAGVLVMFYINFVNGVFNTFQPVIALAAGLSLTQIGILSSCRSWSSSSVRLSSGALFTRIRPEALTVPLVVLAAGSMFVLPSFPGSFFFQLPLFLAVGVSRGLLRVTGSAEAFDRRGEHGMTAALLHAGLDLGKVAGPVLAGLLAQVIGIAGMFRVLPILLVACYLPFHLAARRATPAFGPPEAP